MLANTRANRTDVAAGILLCTPDFRSYAQAMKQRWSTDRAVKEVAKHFSTTQAAARLAMKYV